MAFAVTTHTSPAALATFLTATVTVFKSEDDLNAALPGTNSLPIVTNGIAYTLIEDPQIVNVSLEVIDKGLFYTVILETA